MAYNLTLNRSRNSGMLAKSPSRIGDGNEGHLDSRVKVSAQQYYEKYMAMAHESVAVGDRITAEGFYQYAEHYLRLINEFKPMAVDAQSQDKNDLSLDKDATPAAHAVVAKAQLASEAEESLKK